MKRIVIIGAGECGVRAAFALREQGFDGAVQLLGAEASVPYERPPLSKNPLGEPKPIRPRVAYEAAGIELRLDARAVRIDLARREVECSDGEVLGYDGLLIATGARARLFLGMEGCLTLRTDRDVEDIAPVLRAGARIGIVGGGFIGLELAAAARVAGADVTVFEAAPRLLARAVPEAIADRVQARHVAEGVRIVTGVGVASAGRGRIALADGTVHECDAVLAGVGALAEHRTCRSGRARRG
ncbi:MAG: FAD-dependent oxidoreductase [Geminicoccaceae bacterium]